VVELEVEDTQEVVSTEEEALEWSWEREGRPEGEEEDYLRLEELVLGLRREAARFASWHQDHLYEKAENPEITITKLQTHSFAINS
jgi:hypothetical protein